ncbi:MAG: peptidoglycan DD-metalloendopeptidase family protein [Nitrospirota bacterium]
MRKVVVGIIIAPVVILMMILAREAATPTEKEELKEKTSRVISGTIKEGETLFSIFKRYQLDMGELFKLREAAASLHKLRDLAPGQPYAITLDNDRIQSFCYWIDDDSILNITRNEAGYCAEKKAITYEKRILHKGGVIRGALISSIGDDKDDELLALKLSDIFAWDIDFSTDLQPGDTFKLIVEGLYWDGAFKKYGDILGAEIVNAGTTYRAYRFERDGAADYYDDEGKPLKRAFLKAPLSFRRISSAFSRNRLHPVLKIYRPHHGVDYAAPLSTPVSTVGTGKVIFAGKRGSYGKLVIVRHRNGYETYYGHLSRIAKGIKRGTVLEQGQVIGYVGATGLATGPHLHYEMRSNGRAVNPSSIRMADGEPIPRHRRSAFIDFKRIMDTRLASISPPVVVATERKRHL